MEFNRVTRHGVAWKAKTEAIPIIEIAAPTIKYWARNDRMGTLKITCHDAF
jgi:hypothetical protein